MTLPATVGGVPVGYQTGPEGILPGLPTLVLIHGSGGSRRCWRFQMPLSERFNLLALELPAHGETPGPAPDTVAGYAAWVAEVLDAFNLPAPVVVAGHSLGGAIAQELALTRPDLLAGIAPVGTGAHLPVNPAIFDGLAADYPGTMGLAMKWAYAKTSDPALREETVAETIRLMPAEVVALDFRACDRFDRRDAVKTIGLPVLVICGAQDKMTPPALSEFLKQQIPGADLVLIDQAGHMVMEEQPEAVNRALGEFMEGLRA